MSLFGTVQVAQNTLVASAIGLQVAGNNIANASTPGYSRQGAVFTPGPTQLIGSLPLGMGVRVDGIMQHVDAYLQDRLRSTNSDVGSSEQQEDAYLKLEAVLGELSETDLSTSLNGFFGAINDILNQPESVSVRNLAVLKGQSLADDMRRFSTRVRDLRSSINDRIAGSADRINQFVQEIAKINVQIVAIEGNLTSHSDAVGLRDQRQQALTNLAQIINIHVEEQPTGSVSVFSGGDFLVSDGVARSVNIEYTSDRGLQTADIRIDESDSPLSATSGSLAGWKTARDSILGGLIDQFDGLAQTLIFEFNKVHSSGQGLSGFDDLTSEFSVTDEGAALDAAGLAYTPQNGSFKVLIHNTETDVTKTTDVFIKLTGFEDDTTLQDLAAQLDSIEGLSAALTPTRNIRLTSDSGPLEFSFSNDTSGVLAALGINTFFAGTEALDIGVNSILRTDSGKFAASRGGIGSDADNVTDLAVLQDTELESQNGQSVSSLYFSIAADITQGSAVARAVADGFRTFQQTLEGEKLGISGVSIDDEAVRMMQFQRMYQASARLISTINELLETLINL